MISKYNTLLDKYDEEYMVYMTLLPQYMDSDSYMVHKKGICSLYSSNRTEFNELFWYFKDDLYP